ncbi:queuosine precursor transporter [Wenyingzhuangia sp. 2_MG-2023]|uniref:queuosine precursor transporter n=1 Tax=Wenyingzhuangia sp. 2_MG-2023 TaxID=3062639 RepID=UPI0026E345EF|nr:queuosine precursor transporter [Wenyingzhuangia sp. 2_MG-2023]MDO6738155.1 queuosine precursor transporter [Wenyingzhuangia sp. 2_MG-2023]
MTLQKNNQATATYLILATLFITSLVVSNLIFQKFFYWNPFGWYRFEISVGILPYPITFLITDTISEIYGKKKANQVVIAGIFASVFSMLIILIANVAPALENSPVSNSIFSQVFGLSPLGVLASMLAYLTAQFIDIRIYHFWKEYTQGKHLWLRNNFSTFTSQLVDTTFVVGLLCFFEVLSWNSFTSLVLSGFLFKAIIAILDTPILYTIVFYLKKKFHLNVNDEIKSLKL